MSNIPYEMRWCPHCLRMVRVLWKKRPAPLPGIWECSECLKETRS